MGSPKRCTAATRAGRMTKADQFYLVLLDLKTHSGYSATPTGATNQKRAGRAAAALIGAARAVG